MMICSTQGFRGCCTARSQVQGDSQRPSAGLPCMCRAWLPQRCRHSRHPQSWRGQGPARTPVSSDPESAHEPCWSATRLGQAGAHVALDLPQVAGGRLVRLAGQRRALRRSDAGQLDARAIAPLVAKFALHVVLRTSAGLGRAGPGVQGCRGAGQDSTCWSACAWPQAALHACEVWPHSWCGSASARYTN